ncbi:MAG: hypothetical protein II718_04975 [Clostridiales bacterium]|nr:hypothetical protein [Clostridiales bacterium]
MDLKEYKEYKVRPSEFEFRDPTEAELEALIKKDKVRKYVAIPMFIIVAGFFALMFFQMRSMFTRTPDAFTLVFIGIFAVVFIFFFVSIIRMILPSLNYEVCDVTVVDITGNNEDGDNQASVWSESQQKFAYKVSSSLMRGRIGQEALLVKKVRKHGGAVYVVSDANDPLSVFSMKRNDEY